MIYLVRKLILTLIATALVSQGLAQIKIDTLYSIIKVEDEYPNWSPDGKMITFQSNRKGNISQIYIMNTNGTGVMRISDGSHSSETPRWSPDGSFIMFSGYLDTSYVNNEIFLIEPDGTGLKRITDHPLRDGHPKFSPDGEKIIFNSQRDDEGVLDLKNYELYEMNIDGTNVKRLTNYLEWDTYPSYSPDGKEILWRRILADTTAPRSYNSEIFKMNKDGSGLKNLSNHKSFDGYPEWSPDGKSIVFVSSRHGETTNHLQLFVMDADGSNVQQITWNKVEEEDVRPDWSPDGKKIVFNRVNPDGSRVYIMNIRESKPTIFFNEISSGVIAQGRASSRGVAWGDYNGDGYPDLLVANTMNNSDFLYKNNSQGDFEQIVEGDEVTAAGWTEGANWIDYDNDGDLDIFYTTQFGKPNQLYQNDGFGAFKKIEAGDLTKLSSSSTSACWCDFDLDGDLDVYVVERDGADDALYRNNGNGTFNKVGEARFPYGSGDGRACAWGDTDGDRFPELYVGNFLDKTKPGSRKDYNFYYKNNGDGSFIEITDSPVTSETNLTYGVSFVDYDQDNDLDLFITNIALSDKNLLYQNDGRGNFIKTNTAITKASHRPSKGHTWGDYDNDGDLDLFVVNGTEGTTPKEIMNLIFLADGNGDFEQVESLSIVETPNISAGTAWADYDKDGDLDLFVANWGNNTERNVLYRNDLYKTNWVTFRLKGSKSNSHGIGSKVRIKVEIDYKTTWLSRWLLPQTGYASQNEPIIHFGLKDSNMIENIEILWPSGIQIEFENVKGNTNYLISEDGSMSTINH